MKKIINVLVIGFVIFTITGCLNTKTEANTIKTEIKDIDKNLEQYVVPLGIDSVKLMKNGKVILTVTDKEIGKGEKTIASDVKEVYVYLYGNGGYRTIMFVKNDGTVSIVNSTSLIQDKKIEIIDNLGNYKDIVSIKQETDQEGILIYAVDKNNEEYMLDEYIK